MTWNYQPIFTRALLAIPSALALMMGCTEETTGSSLIVATEGGTVVAGNNTIEIPPAALATDTEITLRTDSASDYPTLENSNGTVVALLPEGTSLSTSATVTLGADVVNADLEQRVNIYQYLETDGEAGWTPVEAEVRTNGSAVVGVSRLAPLGIAVQDAPVGGTIEGTIAWGDSSPVSGAPLELWASEELLDTYTTDSDGGFRFEGLDAGTYGLRLEFECTLEEVVEVVEGQTTDVELSLCSF